MASPVRHQASGPLMRGRESPGHKSTEARQRGWRKSGMSSVATAPVPVAGVSSFEGRASGGGRGLDHRPREGLRLAWTSPGRLGGLVQAQTQQQDFVQEVPVGQMAQGTPVGARPPISKC